MISHERKAEVFGGLKEYRSKLIDQFGHKDPLVEDIRRALISEGLVTNTPLVLIPYDDEQLKKADQIAETCVWQEPSTVRGIRNFLNEKEVLDKGDVKYLPNSGFYEGLIDLMVVTDNRDYFTSLFDRAYSRSTFVTSIAHELTHSVFSGLNSIDLVDADEENVKLLVKGGIGQGKEEVVLFRFGGDAEEYNPCWIDEAFATHMAGEIRGSVDPGGIPPRSVVFKNRWTNKEYGVGEIEIPRKYLDFSEEYPDDPGGVVGNIAAIGLDELSEKRPFVIPQIKALSKGELTVVEFHSNLKNAIGGELYSAMTERRPYNTWGSVLEQVRDLS